MTRQALDAVLRLDLRHTDDRYFEGENPVVLSHDWGVTHPQRFLEEEMNPIAVLKMFGQQKVANAIAKLLNRTTASGFEALGSYLASASVAAEAYDPQATAAAIAAALFNIK